MDSTVTYPNKEFVGKQLERRFADVIVVIKGQESYQLEAQMTKGGNIVLRVFEYGFYHALSNIGDNDTLYFPSPMVIYLDEEKGIPEESILHVSFGNQGTFQYKVKNYVYQQHEVEELNRKRLIVLIPFQALKLRSLVMKAEKNALSEEEFEVLQKQLRDDIIGSIKANLQFGNITEDDANNLLELTLSLYEHIQKKYKESGGRIVMKPLLEGAMELPSDKYRIRIEELEQENARYADENARYANENAMLKKRIAELEKK